MTEPNVLAFHSPLREAHADLQPASVDIWDAKYRLKRKDGTPVDRSIKDTLARVARALAAVERPEVREHWFERFLWALENGAVPAGRILSNAGAEEFKPATSTINCTVSGTIGDSMADILTKLSEAGMTLKGGSGIGYEFSTLRPRGAYVSGADAFTSGPLSFMDVFDSMCRTISSAGGRRGAQMATFDVSHPDVLEFIKAKHEPGRLRQFNLSLLITQDFIDAVVQEADWPLVFPLAAGELAGVDLEDPAQVLWRRWPVVDGYIRDARGLTACRIYRTLPARQLWDAIMTSTYDHAEPGFILVDRVNEMNNLWFCEEIRATNPCGEQPLPPYGACLLGSVDLTAFVLDPFGDGARFDWTRYRDVVRVFTRMLDNVVDVHGLALDGQAEEIVRKRRHGMGFLGPGSAMTMLKMPYGSPSSLAFTEEVARELAVAGWKEGLALAREKGPAPIMTERFAITPELLRQRPELSADGYRAGDTVTGAELMGRYGRYMRQLAQIEPELVAAIVEDGSRFSHHSSIAPTGTISLSLGNNASNGIEPSFAHRYARNVVREGRKTREKVEVFSSELLAYRRLVNPDACPEVTEEKNRLPDYFVAADDILPAQHVDVQAAAQKWIDSSISKTVNVPSDSPFDRFSDIYLYACRKGLKGCTTFRFNPEKFQGVLVREQDLRDTVYEFSLETGETVELRGDEEVEYEGELHTAANLFEALREGHYGRL
ncbi:MAG: adenosylcobalamin-dependent ribonucleoside-diphosphate reductase [Pseudomonadales bacterium]